MITQLAERTTEKWTWGMVSIPLLFGNHNAKGIQAMTWVKDNNNCYKRLTSAMARNDRYLLFETDKKDKEVWRAVIEYYRKLGLDLYWHETMRGYHFLSVQPLDKKLWSFTIKSMLKNFNQDWVGMALRVRPNKWEEEKKYWLRGDIIGNDKELQFLKMCIEKQRIRAIAKKYKVVRYRLPA